MTPDEIELAALNKELAWEMTKSAADVAGILDPTPISDGISASMSLSEGDLVGAGLSLISMVPYLGDALAKTAKGAKAAEKIAVLTEKIAAKTAKIKSISKKTGPAVEKAIEQGEKQVSKNAVKECINECPLLIKEIDLPKGFVTKSSKKGGGKMSQDHTNPHNSIRQMPGNPNSPNASQQNPYVIFKKNGVAYDVNGKALQSATEEAAHIPANQFDINKMPKFK